jgi:hypothetical protein
MFSPNVPPIYLLPRPVRGRLVLLRISESNSNLSTKIRPLTTRSAVSLPDAKSLLTVPTDKPQ